MKKNDKIERFEIRLSGLGGQGILTLGKIMGQALAIEHGFNVTQTQSYGPEARGGASRSDLVLSSNRISYPKTINLDMLVALSQEACNQYFRNLKSEGRLLVDTTLVSQTPTNNYWGLPFTELARDRVGLVQTTNTVTLGALTHLLPFMHSEAVTKSLTATLPKKILEINLKAFNLGLEEAQKEYPTASKSWSYS
jgi:2-oxoglutarate ferredoxin oxidoreductase subunit gamma